MKKSEMVKKLVSNLKVESVTIAKIYGVACGVGYDLDVRVTNTQTGEVKFIQAHANNRSWFASGHLRPNNPYYKYTGSCDRYRERVISAWMDNPNALEYYFDGFNKIGLECFYENGL